MQSWGGMGIGICSSIGAQLAKPDKPVICICGDGGFQMNGTEIATAKQFGIPVIWIIFNDAAWGMPYHGMEAAYKNTTGCTFPKVDFVKFAESLGVSALCVKKPGEVGAAVRHALKLRASGQPVVIDVYTRLELAPPLGLRFVIKK